MAQDEQLDPAYPEKILKRIRQEMEGNHPDPESVKVESAKGGTAHIYARTCLKLSHKVEEKRGAGRAPQNAEKLSQPGQLSSQIDTVETQMRGDSQMREKLLARLRADKLKGWGLTSDKPLRIQDLDKLYASEETCAQCQGAGQSTCSQCRGQGFSECPRCNASPMRGYELCPSCRGEKQLRNSDGNLQNCQQCSGQGYTICTQCQGRGQIMCQSCKGQGRNSCSNCKGKGYSFWRGRVQFSAEPSFEWNQRQLPDPVERLMQKPGPRVLAGKKHIEYRLIDASEAAQIGDDFPFEAKSSALCLYYAASAPYAFLNIRLDDRKIPLEAAGLKGKLVNSPYFLADLIRPAWEMLQNTAKAGGRRAVSELMKASRTRAIREVLHDSARLSGRKAAQNMAARYKEGLSRNHILQLVGDARKALAALTRNIRMVGQIGAWALSLVLLMAYLNTGLRGIITPEGLSRPLGALLDLVVIGAILLVTSMSVQILNQVFLQRILRRIGLLGAQEKPRAAAHGGGLILWSGQIVTVLAGLGYNLWQGPVLPWIQSLLTLIGDNNI